MKMRMHMFSNRKSVPLSLLLLSRCGSLLLFVALTTASSKTFIVFGPPGANKSMVANWLMGRDPLSRRMSMYPNFGEVTSINSPATKFCTAYIADKSIVIDSLLLDMSEPHSTAWSHGVLGIVDATRRALHLLHKALAHAEYRVNAAVFVISPDLLVTPLVVEMFRLVSERILGGGAMAANNTLLVCNCCPAGWLRRHSHSNALVGELVAMCGQRVVEVDFVDEMKHKKQQKDGGGGGGKRSAATAIREYVDKFVPVELKHLAPQQQQQQQQQGGRFDESSFIDEMRQMSDLRRSPGGRVHEPRRVVLVLGHTGSGKSTLANCLVGATCDRNGPTFGTSSGPSVCTQNVGVAIGNGGGCGGHDGLVVIDTAGLDDEDAAGERRAVEWLRRALRLVDYRVDLAIINMRQGRITQDMKQLVERLKRYGLLEALASRSLLACSGCEHGWLANHRAEHGLLHELLATCANRSVEFDLTLAAPAPHLLASVRSHLSDSISNNNKSESANKFKVERGLKRWLEDSDKRLRSDEQQQQRRTGRGRLLGMLSSLRNVIFHPYFQPSALAIGAQHVATYNRNGQLAHNIDDFKVAVLDKFEFVRMGIVATVLGVRLAQQAYLVAVRKIVARRGARNCLAMFDLGEAMAVTRKMSNSTARPTSFVMRLQSPFGV